MDKFLRHSVKIIKYKIFWEIEILFLFQFRYSFYLNCVKKHVSYFNQWKGSPSNRLQAHSVVGETDKTLAETEKYLNEENRAGKSKKSYECVGREPKWQFGERG